MLVGTKGGGSFFLAVGIATAFPFVSSISPISSSFISALLCLRSRFNCTLFAPRFGAELIDAEACGLGGPGAIGTTPLLIPAMPPDALLAVLAAVVLPLTDPVDFGDSESPPLALPEVGVVTGVCANEFLREAFFEDLVDEAPTGTVLPLPRFRFLMTSVFSDSGRTTPCSFKNKPQALQSG